MKIRVKLISVLLCIFVGSLMFGISISNATVVSNDPTVNAGENVSITLTSNKGTESFKIFLVDNGGLTFKSVSVASPFIGETNGSTVNGISTKASKNLATYVFEAPKVEKDTTYEVKFKIEQLSNEETQTNTSVVKVKGTNQTTTTEPDLEPSKSSDTSLKSLTVSPFGKLNSPYDITVDNKYDEITISAVPTDSKAKVSGTGEYSLKEGTNHFKVVVTAEDGTKKEYDVYVRRKEAPQNEITTPPNVVDENENKEEEPKDEPEEKDNNTFGLDNLVVTGVELNPTFDSKIYEYKVELSEDIDTLEIIANANEDDAEVEIVGNTNLKVGENLITIIVTSKDGEKTATYQIIVNKKEPEVVATNTEIDNTQTTAKSEQELKNRIGKIILIALAAIIAVILIGIIAIAYTKKNKSNDEIIDNFDNKKDKNKINKDDFRVSINEDKSYRELEKLSEIHNKNNKVEPEEIIENNKKVDNMNIFEKKVAKDEYLKSYNDVDKSNKDLIDNKIKKSKGKRFK